MCFKVCLAQSVFHHGKLSYPKSVANKRVYIHTPWNDKSTHSTLSCLDACGALTLGLSMTLHGCILCFHWCTVLSKCYLLVFSLSGSKCYLLVFSLSGSSDLRRCIKCWSQCACVWIDRELHVHCLFKLTSLLLSKMLWDVLSLLCL